jgi:hypothetical protein
VQRGSDKWGNSLRAKPVLCTALVINILYIKIVLIQHNDTLRRPQARDEGFYVPPETHVTSPGVQRSGAPREVTWVEGGRKIPFLSEGGSLMTLLYCWATHERERERGREREEVGRQKERFFAYRDIIQITSRQGQKDFGDFPPTDVLTRR